MKDLIGQKFGKLIVISYDGKKAETKNPKNIRHWWLCKCECGKEKSFSERSLTKHNYVKSCGCNSRNRKYFNLEGKKFGKLSAVSFSHRNKTGSGYWMCKCDCGKEKIIRGSYLVNGITKSCGCNHFKKKFNHPSWKGYGEISLSMWKQIMASAKRRKLSFLISIQDAWNLFLKQNKKCVLTGDTLYFSTTNDTYDGIASLDRIDSSRGYEIDNVQWIRKDVNYMKQGYNQSHFVNMCKKIAAYS